MLITKTCSYWQWACGSSRGDPCYEANVDLDCNGKVGYKNLSIAVNSIVEVRNTSGNIARGWKTRSKCYRKVIENRCESFTNDLSEIKQKTVFE